MPRVFSIVPAIGAAILIALGVGLAVKGEIPVPSTVPAASASPAHLSKLAQVILTENNMQSYWVGGVTSWSVAAKGVTVHKISAAQAEAEADELQATVPSTVPMSIPLALLSSESVFDPQCQNGNFEGSNPTKDPWGFDDGVAQLKLKYIEIGGKTGTAAFSSAAAAQAFAFDVTKAIPYFFGIYESHLAEADSWIAGDAPSTIDPRLTNRYVLAALAYKQGDTGAYSIFKSGQWPSELNNFENLEMFFAQQLGTTSVFAAYK